MDRRLALLLALLLPGCSGTSDTTDTKPAAPPVRVAKVEKKEPIAEEPADPLDNFDPSKFSLGDGSSDPAEMPRDEMPGEPMPTEPETASPAKPAVPQDLPPLVVEGAPKPPEPFSGEENAPGTPIPEDVQRVLNSYSDENDDAVMKLVLTFPQAEVRARAAEKLDDIDDERASEALLVARAALRDPDPAVRANAASSIRWGTERDGWKGEEALGELVTIMNEEEAAWSVMGTFQELGPAAAPAVPYLTALLDDPAVENKSEVITTLGAIGPEANPPIAKIAAYAKEMESVYAGRALGTLGAEKALLMLMADNDRDVRETAYQGIRLLKTQSPATVKAVLKGTSDEKEWYERSSAAETLGAIRPTTPEIVDALVRLADDDERYVRTAAYGAMAQLDPPSDRVIPILIAALDKEKPGDKFEIQQALSKAKGSPEIRLQALLRLTLENEDAYLGSIDEGGKEFYPLLKQIVADEKRPVQERALALTMLGEVRGSLDRDIDEVNEEIEAFAQQYTASDQPPELRGAAGITLNECGSRREDTNDLILIAVQSDGFRGTRKKGISILSWREYEPAIPTLIKILKSPDDKLRLAALDGLVNYGELAADAVPAIVNLKFDPEGDDYNSRISSQARALGAIGAQPELSRPLLEKLLAESKPDDYRYDEILAGLAKVVAANDLDASGVLPPIVMMLKSSKQQYERDPAFEMLEDLGPKAASTTELMITYLQSDDSDDRDGAAEALASFGPAAKVAGPALAAAAGSWDDPWRPLEALAAIGAGGPELAAVVPKLLEKVNDRPRVLQAIAAIGPSAAESIPEVVKILDSPDAWERECAVDALAAMKEKGKPALAKLKALALNDDDDDVREKAGAALLAIAPDDPEVVEVAFAQLDVDDEEAVAKFMAELGDGASAFLAARTESKEPSVRETGLKLLSQIEMPREEKLAIYRARLADEDREVRSAAATGMLNLGERTPEVAAVVVSSLTGNGDDWEAQHALYKCGRQAKPALVAVVLSEEKSPELRLQASGLIRDSFDPPTDPAVEPLYAALAGDDPVQKQWAAVALARLAEPSEEILSALIAATEQEGPLCRGAIQGLRNYRGPKNENRARAEEKLVELLQSENEEIAREATNALQYNTLSENALAKITEMLKDEESCSAAAQILSTSETEIKLDAASTESLVAMFSLDDEQEIFYAVGALAACGPSGIDAVVNAAASEESELSAPQRARVLLTLLERDRDYEQPVKLGDAATAKLKTLVAAEPQRVATAAAIVLAQAKVKDVTLGPALLHSFDWDDYQLRGYGRTALAERQSEAETLLPKLIKRLSTETDEEKQESLAYATAKLGKDSPEAIAAVLKVVLASDPDYRQQQLASELSETAKARLGEMLSKLEDPEQKSRALWGYFYALQYQQDDQTRAVPNGLREAMKSDNAEIAFPAALALTQLDPKGAEAVEPLIAELEEEEPKWEAYQGLRRLKELAAPAVPRLMVLLEQPGQRGSSNILQILGEIGPAAAPATPLIAKRVADENLRYHAIEAIKRIGPDAKTAAPALVAQIPGSENLGALAEALIAIGGPTDEVVAEYQRRLADSNLRYDAISSIESISPVEPIAPKLVDALNSDDLELQDKAAHTITYLQKQDPSYLEPLLAHFDSPNPRIASNMIAAAAKQPDSAAKVLPILQQKLSAKESRVKVAAADAIGEYKEEAKGLVPELVPLVADKSLDAALVRSLGDIGPPAAPAVPEIDKLLRIETKSDGTPNWIQYRRQQAAITALGQIGPASKSALPKLLTLYGEEQDGWKKEQIGEAIWKIDAETAQQAGIEPPPEEDQ